MVGDENENVVVVVVVLVVVVLREKRVQKGCLETSIIEWDGMDVRQMQSSSSGEGGKSESKVGRASGMPTIVQSRSG